MLDAICVIGHPSRLGGADTELDHQISCWLGVFTETHAHFFARRDIL